MTPASEPFLDVSGILEPTSVAVIGASERPGNLGGDTVRRLVKFGFPGPVWPVNRTALPVAGLPAFSAVAKRPRHPGKDNLHPGPEARGQSARSIQPPPRTRVPAYSTAAWPGVTAVCASANVTRTEPSSTGSTRAAAGG